GLKLAICLQVASAVAALHSCHIIHADIKLENVLVCKRADSVIAKLADFGNSVYELSSEGEYQCTKQYAAPELLPTGSIPRSGWRACDIYAYGLLVWEVVLN